MSSFAPLVGVSRLQLQITNKASLRVVLRLSLQFEDETNDPLKSGPALTGVTGNPIRAYTDPGGSDPLAKSILRIIFTSGSDPPPDQFY